MKKYFITILAALLFASCGQVPDAIKPGDLLFVAIPADYDPDPQAVVANDPQATAAAPQAESQPLAPHSSQATGRPLATHSPQATAAGQNPGRLFIHAAILDVDTTGIWIIDATLKHGVDRHPLDTFLREFTLKDGSLPTLEVYRLKDQSHIQSYLENTKTYLGEQYDVDFQQDNGKHYCTELIYDSYQQGEDHIFTSGPIDFRNTEGEFPVYWQFLFNLISTPIPQGNEGTLPASMRKEIRASNKFQQIHYENQNR